MELNVKLDPLAYLPERAHPTDAGLDLRTPHDVLVMPGVGAVVDTGVHIQLPAGTVGMLKSKSGLNVRRLYNHGPRAVQFKRGDKITQLVVLPVLYPQVVQTDEITGGPRGDDGYGSTGR